MALDDLLLPEGVVLLHVGPRKTGTTGIQAGLAAARGELSSYGVDYPEVPRGPSWTHYDRTRAASPGWAVMGTAPPGFAVPEIQVWEAFAEQVRAKAEAGLRVCVSSETFGNVADPELARRIVADLGGDNVHVVYTSRALYRLLPSDWQQSVKVNVDTRSYDDWLRIVLSKEDVKAARRAFWYAHDVRGAAEAWLAAIEPARLNIIVTDDSDRGLIPKTIEGMLGLPDGLLAPRSHQTNVSLDLGDIELLRRLNEVAREKGWSTKSFTMLERGTTSGLTSGRDPKIARRSPVLPEWAIPEVVRRSGEDRDLIERLGVRVIGDPSCLVLAEGTGVGAEDSCAPESVSMDTAVSAVAATMQASLREVQRLRRASQRRQGMNDQTTGVALDGVAFRALALELLKRLRRRLSGRKSGA